MYGKYDNWLIIKGDDKMNRQSGKVFGLVMLLVIGLLACGGEAPQQKHQESALEKMKPKKEDRLSKLMDRDWDNLTYILYGFMNFDSQKIKTGTANLADISPYMAKGIGPQHKQYRKEWNEQCNKQRELAVALGSQFADKDFDAALVSLKDLIKNCMECHKVYRKHLLEDAFDE
jgi:cytochrome c556